MSKEDIYDAQISPLMAQIIDSETQSGAPQDATRAARRVPRWIITVSSISILLLPQQALSWFGGRRANEVAALSETDMEAMQEQLRQWSEMLGTHSIAATIHGLVAVLNRERCSYEILESPMGVEHYVATLKLTPVTDGARCFAEWSAEFECEPGRERELTESIGQGVFQGGFDALKRHFGGR